MTKILIAGSPTEERHELRRLLESAGYQVIEAADAAQLLTALHTVHPDLVLLERSPTGAGEPDLLAILRANPATAALPMIVLTSRPHEPTHQANDIEYLSAPIDAVELLASIRSALRTGRVQAELRRRNEQLSALVSVMEAANSTLDLNELAQRVLERALVVTALTNGSIWLRDGETLVCLACFPPSPPGAGRPPTQPLHPDTPIGRVMLSGQPEFAPQQRSDPHQSAAILPLIARGEVIGVFVFGADGGTAIPPSEHAVLGAIAAHVAVAIQHAQLYQQAERQRRQLQAIDRQKDEFISITSHELKNPLASIKGYADLMLRRSARRPDDPNRKGLEIIAQQVNRMTNLLDQLLDVSRIGRDSLQLDRRPADLAAIAARIVEEMRGTTEHHQLVLEIQGAPLIGSFDEARIGQVIANLLSNAIKYSPGGGPIVVRVQRLDEGRPTALLTVRDQGIGIPAADRERLFERFFRASNVSSSFAGMGLGLFITRGLVVRHGGRIWVESEEGRGTTFYVAMPLVSSET